MVGGPSTDSLLARAEEAWAGGDGPAAMELFGRAAAAAEAQGNLTGRARAVIGLARGQRYNLSPGSLPVRLHTVYELVDEPGLRASLAAALARCWAYANEPRRARPFAIEALQLAQRQDDPVLLADALDAALVTHWGPGDLAMRRGWAQLLGDAAAHLADPDARLQAELWTLTVAWEVLDLPAMHRSVRAVELLADESSRAEFFAATRRLPIELLRGRLDLAPALIERATVAAEASVIPDAEGVLHAMAAYTAYFAGDAVGCADRAPAFESYALEFGVPAVRAEGALIWLGAGRLDKVAELIGPFSSDVLAALPRDSDWLLILQCLLEAALAVEDRDVAAAVVALLAPYPGRSVVNAGAVMWHGITDDTLARAYALLGDLDAARLHRADALATYQRIGAVWWRDRLARLLPDAVDSDAAESDAGGGLVRVHLHRHPGGMWLVGRAGATFVLPGMRGLSHLHALVSRPDAEVDAIALVGGTVEQSDLEVLDDETRRVLGARLARLTAELREAETSELRDERDAIAAYLATGFGLGGRRRGAGSNAERARVAVRKAIVAALARIAEADPWLARHLQAQLRTGFGCCYRNDPDHPVRWILDAAGDGAD